MEHDIIISPRISSLYDKNKDRKNFRKDSERKKERKNDKTARRKTESPTLSHHFLLLSPFSTQNRPSAPAVAHV